MAEERKINFKLEPAGPINVPEVPGIIVHAYVALDHYQGWRPHIPYGIWQPNDPKLHDFLSKLADCIGPRNRMKAYNLMQSLNYTWPVDNNGVPAYLSTFQVLFITKEGTLIEYDFKEIKDVGVDGNVSS